MKSVGRMTMTAILLSGLVGCAHQDSFMGGIEHGGLSSGVTSGMEGAAVGPGSQGGQGCKGTCRQADPIGK